MKSSGIVRVAMAVLALHALAPAANAQLGGLIKRKVTDAVKGEDKKPAPANDEFQAAITGDVIEITPKVLDGFVRGLETEVKLTKEFRAELAKYPSHEAFRKCQSETALTPEGQKISMGMAELPENATPADVQRAIEKMNTDMQVLIKKRCPLDPNEWNPQRVQARMAEIKEKAAAATGLSAPESEPATLWPEGDEGGESWAPFPEPFAAAALTPQQYAMLLERIQRFCEELKTNAALGKGGVGGVKIPGAGGSALFWVYTAQEAQTLSQANCQRVRDLIGQLTP